MCYRKSLLVFAFAALAFAFVPHANARSLFRDSGIPSDSNTGGSIVGYKYEGCFDNQAKDYFTIGAITLDCQQLGPNQEEAGSCSDGIPAVKEDALLVKLTKGNKNNNSSLTRLDGQGFQTTQGNKTVGWPDVPFSFLMGGAKNSKLNNKVYTAIRYEPGTDANGNTVANATLVLDLSTPLASGGEDTLAMALTAAKLTFSGLELNTDALLCAQLFEESSGGLVGTNAQGKAFATGSFDGSLTCNVENDTWVTPCAVQALVTQAHSGRFKMEDNNFAACTNLPNNEEDCGQVWHQPDVNLNKNFIRRNFPQDGSLCEGCVLSATFKGQTGLSDLRLRACISHLGAIPKLSINDHTVNINCDFTRNGAPIALEEIGVSTQGSFNPGGSQDGTIAFNFESTASTRADLLLTRSVVVVMTRRDKNRNTGQCRRCDNPCPGGCCLPLLRGRSGQLLRCRARNRHCFEWNHDPLPDRGPV
jgi:hypothetical protein